MIKVNSSAKLETFIQMLFGRVYTNVSAIIYINADGTPLYFHQFDSYAGFPTKLWKIPNNCMPVLVSNHPEGNIAPTTDDMRNLANMRKRCNTSVQFCILADTTLYSLPI